MKQADLDEFVTDDESDTETDRGTFDHTNQRVDLNMEAIFELTEQVADLTDRVETLSSGSPCADDGPPVPTETELRMYR